MTTTMDEAETPGPRWCMRCRQRVRLEGPPDLIEQFRKAVHADTGDEEGPDGHLAAPVDIEPPLRAAGRQITGAAR
jgi:hypothetical protein